MYISDYLYVGIFIIAMVAFFDVLLKFRSPKILKFLLIVIICNVLIFSFIRFSGFNFKYNRLLFELPTQILGISYVIFISQLYQNKISKYVLYFCMALLFIILFIPFYFYFQYGIDVINENLFKNTKSSYSISLIKIIFVSIFFFLTSYLLYNILNRYKHDNIYYKSLRNWCSALIIFSLISGIFNLLFYFFDNLLYLKLIAHFFAYFLPTLALIYRPNFLNNFTNDIEFFRIFTRKSVNNISSESFNFIFFTQMYYLTEKVTLSDFSIQMKTNQENIIEYILLKHNTNFIDIVNQSRIKYFVQLVNIPKNRDYTLDTLAKMSGFSSRQNLTKYFKKYHGGNPSDLITIMGSNPTT